MSTPTPGLRCIGMTQHIRIASRASAMATAQVNWLMEEITRTSPGTVLEFVPITTAGDSWTGPLADVGGKGAFTSAVARAALAERTLLRALAGHCHAPIAGHATAHAAEELHLAARVYTPDGSAMLAAARTGPAPQTLGRAVAQDLIAQGANDLLASSRRR